MWKELWNPSHPTFRNAMPGNYSVYYMSGEKKVYVSRKVDKDFAEFVKRYYDTYSEVQVNVEE